MRKTDYVEAVMDEVEEFLSINDISDDYELSAANVTGTAQPVLIVEYPDNTCRAYNIPYREELVNAAEELSDLNVSTLMSDVNGDIMAYEADRDRDSDYDEDEDYEDDDSYEEDDDYEDEDYDEEDEYEEDDDYGLYHNKDYYKDYDTDYLDEFTETAKEWLHDYKVNNPDKVIDESAIDYEKLNDIYQNNDASFHKTMKTEISKLTRDYTEDYYEDYDTDYADEFENMARQYIKDNRNILSTDYEEVAECVDYEELNEEYQENDLSFRETMIEYLSELGVLNTAEEHTAQTEHNEDTGYEPPVAFELRSYSELNSSEYRKFDEFRFSNSLINNLYTVLPISPVVSGNFMDMSREEVRKTIMEDTSIKKNEDGIFEITSKSDSNVTGVLLFMDEILDKLSQDNTYRIFRIGIPHEGKILVEYDLPIALVPDFTDKLSEEYEAARNDEYEDIKPITADVCCVDIISNEVHMVENSRHQESSNEEDEEQGWDIEF